MTAKDACIGRRQGPAIGFALTGGEVDDITQGQMLNGRDLKWVVADKGHNWDQLIGFICQEGTKAVIQRRRQQLVQAAGSAGFRRIATLREVRATVWFDFEYGCILRQAQYRTM